MSNATAQYLAIYAEHESRELSDFPEVVFDRILVIPSFRETSAFAERLKQKLLRKKVLAVVVINQPPGEVEPLNRELWVYLQDNNEMIWRRGHLCLMRAHGGELHWLMVDRFNAGRTIERKFGVGLARKIGCDIAAALIEKKLCPNNWIYTTDADAHLPDNYFNMPLNASDENFAATVFSVAHITPTEETGSAVFTATKLYEKSLDYYVRGLQWAGSPYAFPTIGSALAVDARSYCQARGFPQKAGGEDFYLLNKLAKLGRIHWAREIQILVEARLSDRAPFGTGPAVQKILSLENRAQEYTYYTPAVFAELKNWLAHIPSIWQTFQKGTQPLDGLPDVIQCALANAGIEALWSHIRRQIHDAAECEKVVHHWFDAFQTLKFIRRLQEASFPALPFAVCVELAPFMKNSPCAHGTLPMHDASITNRQIPC